MKKQYIISENQLKYLVGGILNESPTVDYVFNEYGVNHGNVFFNGAKQYSPLEGKYSGDTKEIRLFDKYNHEYSFDVEDVKFTKDGRQAPYVSLSKFNEKYGKKDKTTLNITDNQIKLAYRHAVFNALQQLYQETSNWDSKSGRGPKGRGGVVNMYQVGDFVKEIGLENFEGGDWSIMNYFDTNPKVMERIIMEYKLKNNLGNISNIDDFKKWIINNKKMLFQDKSFLDQIVEINKQSYLRGLKNEIRAFDFVKSIIGDYPGLHLSSLNLPGSPKDRSGVDFSLIKDGKEIMTYQAKPFFKYEINDYNGKKTYRIYSYNIKNLENLNVNRFVFASDGREGAIIFENRKGGFTINEKGDVIDFNYPPKNYDPNF